MKRFISIFLSLTALELAFYLSPLRIDETRNPDAKYTLNKAIDTLEMKYDGHIYVKTTVNNDTASYWFLWDTGAQASFIDEELVQQYQLQEIGIGRNIDSNLKAREVIKYRIDTLHFNNSLYEDFHFSGLAIEKPKCSEKSHRGIIGANIISKTNWAIDYRNRKLYIIHPDSAADDSIIEAQRLSDTLRLFSLPITTSTSKGVPKVALAANDEIIDDVIFDTGYNGSIVLPMKIYERNASLFGEDIQLRSHGEISKGLFGTVSGSSLHLNVQNISVGNLTLQDQMVNFQAKTVKLLGNGILRNYFIKLNYRGDNIKLLETPVKKKKYKVVNRGFGFSFRLKDGALIVTRVNENSPAYEAGIEYGDEILCVNEQRYEGDECNVNEWYSQFLCETILLEIKGKGTIELEYLK